MYTANATQTPIKASLLTDSAEMISRLANIRERIVSLSNQIHGPEPREAAAKAQAPEPSPSIARNLVNAHRVAAEIEDELSRVESRL